MDKFRHDIWKPAQVIVNSFMAHIVGDICSNSQSIQKCCQHCNRKFSLLGNSAFFFMISWLQAKIKNFFKKNLSKSWKKKYNTWIKSLLLIVHCFFFLSRSISNTYRKVSQCGNHHICAMPLISIIPSKTRRTLTLLASKLNQNPLFVKLIQILS